MFTQWSEVIHAHPLTFKASQNGLEMGLPKKTVVPTQRKDVEIFYPHEPDLIFAPTGFKPESAKLKIMEIGPLIWLSWMGKIK